MGTFASLASPLAVEVIARSGADFVIVDLEHGATGDSQLLGLLHAAEAAGVRAIVRPEEGTRLRIGRALDLGADGVLVPRVDDASQALQVVSWTRYPPDGSRGLALMTRGAGLGSVPHAEVRSLNAHSLVAIQVETRPGLEDVEAIAAIDGVDVLFLGPTDLSHALAMPGEFNHPAFGEAAARIAQAARRHDKVAGVYVRSSRDAASYTDVGFSFLVVGSDAAFTADAAQQAIGDVRNSIAE